MINANNNNKKKNFNLVQNEFTFGSLIKQWVKKHFKIIADITYNSFVTMEMEGHTSRALHCGIQCLS